MSTHSHNSSFDPIDSSAPNQPLLSESSGPDDSQDDERYTNAAESESGVPPAGFVAGTTDSAGLNPGGQVVLSDLMLLVRELADKVNVLTMNTNAQAQSSTLAAQAVQAAVSSQPPGPPPAPQPTWGAPAPAPTPVAGKIRVRDPRIFNGKADQVEGFINEIDDNVFLQRASFADDMDKAYYLGRHLKDGSPVDWFTNLKREQSPLLLDFVALKAAFVTHFGTSNQIGYYLRKIETLQQTGSAASYISSFKDCCAHLDLTEQTKIAKFKKGLKKELKDYLVGVIMPATFALMEPLVLQVDNDLTELNYEIKAAGKSNNSNNSSHKSTSSNNFSPFKSASTTAAAPAFPSIPGTEVVPMEVDAIKQTLKLTKEERKRRMDNNLCLYAGCEGHVSENCPIRQANMEKKGKGKGSSKK